MKDIHEKVLTHLRINHPELCFTLRKIDKGGRLRKGYWFLGNDGYLCVSFWQGQDWRNKTPNIYFIIRPDYSTSFELVDKEYTKKRLFFEKIAKPLKMKAFKTRKGTGTNKWERMYSTAQDMDCIDALDSFLKNEKLLLDTLISVSDCAKNFPPIETKVFEKELKNIEKYRKLNALPTKQNVVKESYPLSITSLKLTNISHFNNLEIDLSKRVTCLIGKNGSGKTTILRAIVFSLVGFSNDAFVREDIEKLEYELKNFLRIEKAGNGRIEYAKEGKIELLYNKTKKNTIKFSPLLGGINDEGRLRGANEVDIDDSKSDFDALDDAGNFKNLVISFSQIKSAEEIESTLEDENMSLREIYSLLYNAADFSFASVQSWIAKAFNANSSVNERQKAIDVLTIAFQIMSQITGESMELGDIEPNKKAIPLVKTPDSPNGIPMNLVSQGYENLIGWVGYLVKRLSEVTKDGEDFTKTPAICLIDELDTYLHPKWQRNLLRVLVDTFPNIQFIVTTHSPQVVMNMNIDNENVIRIENGKAHPVLFVEGRDANSLSTDAFGLSKRLPQFEKILDDIHDLIDREEKDKAEEKINYLKQKWGEADVDLHRAQSYFEMI
jgi:predicted ATP-binding protein involved in virulence